MDRVSDLARLLCLVLNRPQLAVFVQGLYLERQPRRGPGVVAGLYGFDAPSEFGFDCVACLVEREVKIVGQLDHVIQQQVVTAQPFDDYASAVVALKIFPVPRPGLRVDPGVLQHG